ncbi:hypothetical protein [Membranihabitans maritimus]|uniref:hypothetical protein n=1 Tax=Membranihabitans maritimus TaxID=2904244 RepID=UPI001F2D4370|nr:hypothetical protein [Membranihabitans maritimus]
MILDFKEIALANTGSGDQDMFELFARDFLSKLGFEIKENPARGSDGGTGKDLLVVEYKQGYTGVEKIQWLVSCKHNAHSGSSVGVSDEIAITDRVIATGSQGFMGFYSTLPSSGLSTKFEGIKANSEIKIFYFDRAKIEEELTEKDYLIKLAMRYLPVSTTAWQKLVSTQIKYSHEGLDAIVRGTWTFDFVKGGPGEVWICDFHWEIISIETDEKYIAPHNGTKLTLINGIGFSEIDKAYLETLEYHTNKVKGQKGDNCEIFTGTILGFKRKDGVYVKMIIQEVGYSLKFKYQTYE